MAGRFRFNRNFNINRVVKRLVRTVLALYVGGTIMTTFGDVVKCTVSPFYEGLSLIGYTVSDSVNTTSIGSALGINCTTSQLGTTTASQTVNNVITSTSGSGILAVVGIIALAQVVTEFITW